MLYRVTVETKQRHQITVYAVNEEEAEVQAFEQVDELDASSDTLVNTEVEIINIEHEGW